jgi:DNA polymerase-3 subunit alpha
MKYEGYFLIVADFIKWAKYNNIPVGPGRGSGAGSLVAWCLEITDLDPIHFGLIFERFLNPERVSLPDFDIDFCRDRRDEVLNYVYEKYGKDHVAQIITFGKLQARAVLRDIGRVLGVPYGQVDYLTKLIPFDPSRQLSLREYIDDEPKLTEEANKNPKIKKLLSIALKLEGLKRHASIHAAGVVISKDIIYKDVPLYSDPDTNIFLTQFDMKWVENAGLVKFDFLGLKTLTLINNCVDLVNKYEKFDISEIDLTDTQTFDLLGTGETTGIFQLESPGMKDTLKNLKPDKFEDIIALVALYRPGPMANIPTYIERKHGREKPDYVHPLLEDLLKETYGVIIYQEQVMGVARELSGYSDGEADLLRRAMGKKIQKEMTAQKKRFVEGCISKGLKDNEANNIFELLSKFADYGFNKSHAAAYALIAFQTAYLKKHYPIEFFAASMSLDINNTDKLAIFQQELDRMKIPLIAPDVNKSNSYFVREGDGISYALGAIKNVGIEAIKELEEERNKNGNFKDFEDFLTRVSSSVSNKKTLEALACSGSFDSFNIKRENIFNECPEIIKHLKHFHDTNNSNQEDIFGEA